MIQQLAGYENWNSCRHCGGIHSGTCPKIKSIEYYRDGSVKKIEYKQDELVWPQQDFGQGGNLISPDYDWKVLWTY